MKNVRLFDSAMGSPSGIGLVTSNLEHSQDELLRVATLLAYLKDKGFDVTRANMSTRPDIFLMEEELLDEMMDKGNDVLPAWYDGKTRLWSGRYPSNEEVAEYYGLEEIKENLPPLSKEAFDELWQEASAWGMCNTSDCSSCSGCG